MLEFKTTGFRVSDNQCWSLRQPVLESQITSVGDDDHNKAAKYEVCYI